jgi:putative endonuclease
VAENPSKTTPKKFSKKSGAATAPNPRQHLGRTGEAAAARFLASRGYRIVARNVRADRVEIDLVARRGGLLVFVEVKARSSERYGSPAEAVDLRKQRRLRRGARAWLASRPTSARGYRSLRFDVVTCLRSGARRSQEPEPGAVPAPQRFGVWVRDESTAPGGAGWWIEHWEAAF